MTGAMYAAIGGLRSHMSKLNVIGNNIANVNTYGYKSQRMTFKESIYGTNRSGSNGGVITGGNNPSQTGYGCTVGTIDLNMSPSTYSPTGVDLDCYIAGDGFFILGDKLQKEEEYDVTGEGADATATLTNVTWSGGVTSGDQLKDYDLSRVGDFWVDPDGYICNGDGKIVYGFARVQNPDYIPNPTPAQVALAKQQNKDISETIISTHLVPLRVPLQAAAPTLANGGKYEVTTGEGADAKKEVLNHWEEGDPVYPFLNSAGQNQYAEPGFTKSVYVPEAVDADGKVTTPSKYDDTNTSIGIGASVMPTAENKASDAVSNVMPCQMREMAIGTDGAITGIANGKTVVIGYIAIASADNPNGVTHTSGPYYKCMPGAGNMRVSTAGLDLNIDHLGNKMAEGDTTGITGVTEAGTASTNDKIWSESKTQLQSQGLEASSTDLAYEFAEMVTTQRGYQANTRIVSVTDSMLEELVNMKR